MLFLYLLLMLGCLPVSSSLAWAWPRVFRALLLSVASFTMLVVAIVRFSQSYDLHHSAVPQIERGRILNSVSYLEHDKAIGLLFLGMWGLATGLPAAWLRQHRISPDQAVSLAFVLIATIVWPGYPSYPMAEALRSYFMGHRPTFERLAQMACHDIPENPTDFVGAIRWQDPAIIPPDRLAVYRRLLHDVGLTLMEIGADEAQGESRLLVLFYHPPRGYVERLVNIIYACDAIPSALPVSTLDAPVPQAQRYQVLAPHWYLEEHDEEHILP